MYVEFTRRIAPKFSKGGSYLCEIDGTPTYCSTSETGAYERRLAILINKDLDPGTGATANTYKVSVTGIGMPASLGNYLNLYIALS